MDSFLTQFNAISPIDWFEWLGMATGITGVWLSIKVRIGAWPFFILCYGCYVYLGLSGGLFAFAGMNISFIGISIYGWKQWSNASSKDASSITITRTAPNHWIRIAIFLITGTFIAGFLGNLLDGARLPYLDAFAACCGFTAQWMLGRKHIETWIFWIIADVIYLGLFLTTQNWPTVILFTIFIVLAIRGWVEWKPLLDKSMAQGTR